MGSSGGGVAAGSELAIAIRVPHSTYATKAERNSRLGGSPASSALAAIRAAQRDRCCSVIDQAEVVAQHGGVAPEVLGVVGGTAEHLAEPLRDVVAVVAAHVPEHRLGYRVREHPVVEDVGEAVQGVGAAAPVEEGRHLGRSSAGLGVAGRAGLGGVRSAASTGGR